MGELRIAECNKTPCYNQIKLLTSAMIALFEKWGIGLKYPFSDFG
jgi:hypothetical protein